MKRHTKLLLIILTLVFTIPVFGVSRPRDPKTRVIDSNYLWRLDETGGSGCCPYVEPDPEGLIWHYGNDPNDGVC